VGIYEVTSWLGTNQGRATPGADEQGRHDAGDTCLFGDMKIIAELYKPDIASLLCQAEVCPGVWGRVGLAFRTIMHAIVHPQTTARCFLRSPDRTIAWASSSARP
jgi:hypothetical protein